MVDLAKAAEEIKDIKVDALAPQELVQLKKQLDEEIQMLSNSYTQLMHAASKFETSKNRSGNLLKQNVASKEMLVPLTSSLYMPGFVCDSDRVLVEIGGTYFVETGIKQSQEYCERKKEQIHKNTDAIMVIINKKKGIQEKVIMQLQRTLFAQHQAQQKQQQQQHS